MFKCNKSYSSCANNYEIFITDDRVLNEERILR